MINRFDELKAVVKVERLKQQPFVFFIFLFDLRSSSLSIFKYIAR